MGRPAAGLATGEKVGAEPVERRWESRNRCVRAQEGESTSAFGRKEGEGRQGRNGGGRRSGAHIFQRCGCGCEAADREGGAWVRRTERRRMEEEKGGGGRRTEEERYA